MAITVFTFQDYSLDCILNRINCSYSVESFCLPRQPPLYYTGFLYVERPLFADVTLFRDWSASTPNMPAPYLIHHLEELIFETVTPSQSASFSYWVHTLITTGIQWITPLKNFTHASLDMCPRATTSYYEDYPFEFENDNVSRRVARIAVEFLGDAPTKTSFLFKKYSLRFNYKIQMPCFIRDPAMLVPNVSIGGGSELIYFFVPLVAHAVEILDSFQHVGHTILGVTYNYSLSCFIDRKAPGNQFLQLNNQISNPVERIKGDFRYACRLPFSPTDLRQLLLNEDIILNKSAILTVRDNNNRTDNYTGYPKPLPVFQMAVYLYRPPVVTQIIVNASYVLNGTSVEVLFIGTNMQLLKIVPAVVNCYRVMLNKTVLKCLTFPIDFGNSTQKVLNFTLYHQPQFARRPAYLHDLGGVVVFHLEEPYSWFYDNPWYISVALVFLVLLVLFTGLYTMFNRYHIILTPADYVEKILLKNPFHDDSLAEMIEVHGISKKLLISPADIIFREKIGRGGFAQVFKGIWKHTEVAVKKLNIPDDDEGIQQILEDYFQEATVMIELRHQNIVSLLGLCIGNPDFLIVTEYMERGTLSDILLNQNYIIEPAHQKKFALDCCYGMSYLHSVDLIHRDLKGKNLLVDKAWNVKVCDFGLSRFIEGVNKNNQYSLTSCGTPVYAAPEVLKGQKYTTSADIYSFAIVLWEIWTRQLPFQGISPYQIIVNVTQNKFRPKLPDDMNLEISSLINMCWNENCNTRPSFDQCINHLFEIRFPVPQSEFPVLLASEPEKKETGTTAKAFLKGVTQSQGALKQRASADRPIAPRHVVVEHVEHDSHEEEEVEQSLATILSVQFKEDI